MKKIKRKSKNYTLFEVDEFGMHSIYDKSKNRFTHPFFRGGMLFTVLRLDAITNQKDFDLICKHYIETGIEDVKLLLADAKKKGIEIVIKHHPRFEHKTRPLFD